MRLWKPALYHGWGKKKVFFEGWYYKLISADLNQRWAVIPGIFHHPDPAQAHSFIQILDGMGSQVVYHRFPFESFKASRSAFMVEIAGNYFHSKGLSLDLSGQGQAIQGDLSFEKLVPWPITLLSPGVMGPYRFAPFMQTYHGIISLDHDIQGSLSINGSRIDFSGGRGYMEKDWGSTFPRAYIWMQSNHFSRSGVSLTASVATIPWLTGWFRGFLVGLLIDGKLYRFTTYLGSEISSLELDDVFVNWSLLGGSKSGPEKEYATYYLSIKAEKSEGGLLLSPELDGMTPRILESLTASLEIELLGFPKSGNEGKVIYQGKGTCGGLEIAGSIEEIADQIRD
jgi:hypothetical protein